VNDPNNQAARTPAVFRPIVLLQSHGQWLASPAKGECSAGRGFTPFFLSLPPKSLVDWLVVAGHRFWQQKKRCMAGVLLVDCQSGRWTLRLPRQNCGIDSARWSISAVDFPKLANSMRIGGSFQTLATQCSLEECIPTVPGFHFILTLTGEQALSAFIRDGQGLRMAEPIALLTNTWVQAIDAAMPRLRLA
jgi:hypothetical protein